MLTPTEFVLDKLSLKSNGRGEFECEEGRKR